MEVGLFLKMSFREAAWLIGMIHVTEYLVSENVPKSAICKRVTHMFSDPKDWVSNLTW